MIKFRSLSSAFLTRGTSASAGYDLHATKQVTIAPLERVLVPTGIFIEDAYLEGFSVHFQICPRSGLALTRGITVLNAPGIVDADFIEEIQVLLVNLSSEAYTIAAQDRIAQLVPVVSPIALEVWLDDTKVTARTKQRSGGFGSTGK